MCGRPLIDCTHRSIPDAGQHGPLGKAAGQPILDADGKVERLAQPLGGQAAAQERRTVQYVDRLVCQQPLRKLVGLFPTEGRQAAVGNSRPIEEQVGVTVLQPLGMRDQEQPNFRVAAERWSGEKVLAGDVGLVVTSGLWLLPLVGCSHQVAN